MSSATSAAAEPARRIPATPYARRLARERKLPLSAIIGSGPNGRIAGDDVAGYAPAIVKTPAPIAETPRVAQLAQLLVAEVLVPAIAAAAPAAIVVRVEFPAVDALLVQIAEVRPEVTREDICLKAAAAALQGTLSSGPDGAVLLLAGSSQRRFVGLANASISAIAAMRANANSSGAAELAVSFIGRQGVRPVAARLVEGAAARLVVGAPDKEGGADCLLSYDPARIVDDRAEEYLAVFKDLVETPLRLLV